MMFRWHWSQLGRRDTFGAILTQPHHHPSWGTDQFFKSGRDDVVKLMEAGRRLVPSFQTRRAFDFGCGVGRLTQAFTHHFESVIGVDIADSMVAAARGYNQRPEMCQYAVVTRVRALRGFSRTSSIWCARGSSYSTCRRD